MITAAQRAVYRKMLLEAGFSPVPLNGKRPVLDDWPSLIATGADIERWAQERSGAQNTGYLTRWAPTLDIDIINPEAAEAVENLVKDRFGDCGAVLVRVGRAPKRAIPFRTDQPFTKIVASLVAPNGHEERIEFLADGQQCVADGDHPDTHQPYRWLGGSPGIVKRDELPAIDERAAQELVNDAAELLTAEYGYRRRLAPAAGPKLNGAAAGDAGAWGFLSNAIDHDSLTSGAMALLQAGMHDAAAVNFLRTTVTGLHDVDEDRRQRRLDEIPAMVRSARAKLGAEALARELPDYGEVKAPAVVRGFKLNSLAGLPVPPREWHVEGLIPAGAVTLLGGDGGVGKTILALQLAFDTAVGGLRWIGQGVRPGRALHLSAEDDRNELHRRSDLISVFYGEPLDRAEGMTVWPLADEEALLATGEPGKPLQTTALWLELQRFVELDKPALVVLDSLADVYGANENDRSQARQFVRLLRSLALPTGTAVVLLGHPSLTGLSSGSGLSGSTAWNNSVRQRLNLLAAKTEEGATAPDLRKLEVKKANYTQAGAELQLRWVAGAFELDGEAFTSGLDQQIAADKIDELFLVLVDAFKAEGRFISHNGGRAYAPTQFAADPRARGTSSKAFTASMNRLFAASRIRVATRGPPSRSISFIART